MKTAASPMLDENVGYFQWSAVIGGALAAAALAFVLHSFAVAIGLAVSSPAPTWRDSSVALQVLSGLYLVLVALVSYGLGGYIAGRARSTRGGGLDDIEFRDGTHGLLVWGMATIVTGLLALATIQATTRLVAPSAGSSGSAQSVAGENVIAFDLDRLFRSERRPANFNPTYARSEAARILLTSAGHNGVAPEDRAYLIRLTATETGLAPPDSEKRVDAVITQAKNNIGRARRAAVILAFMAGAAALLGAAVAWFAACAGGRHKDSNTAPSLNDWNWRTLRSVR